MATKRKAKPVIKKTVKTKKQDTTLNTIWGWVFILLGAYLLFGNSFGLSFSNAIALALLVGGLIILIKKRQV